MKKIGLTELAILVVLSAKSIMRLMTHHLLTATISDKVWEQVKKTAITWYYHFVIIIIKVRMDFIMHQRLGKISMELKQNF
jgi:hypothetical protein